MELKRPRAAGALAGLALAVTLTGCGGSIQDSTAAADTKCGDLNLAINPWVGYEANAHVVGYVAKTRLGCNVNYKDLDEQVSWKGFGSGEVDVVIENWGHPELQKKYMKSAGGDGSAVDFGSTGNEGVIGWFVPPWMAEKYPDITDSKNLNKYADLFRTPESGDKGTLYDGDPGFVTNDEALVSNLGLDYKVVYAGSETALIEAFREAEENHKPMLGYFYDPQWFLSEVALVKVDLPDYTEGCDADPAKVACDYPVYDLNKVVSKKFADSDSPAVGLVQNFTWTNEDQNLVAKYISEDQMDPEDAAKKWVEDHKDEVDAWLKG
ncbi:MULTISPECIES: ABC transporter substrate-binding protein [unclassified Nocardioides]|uniref:ABC transporter substrate-binding protein n=1 Tax=unclassified Nocardioides TaxID=2615069 RepID=UPI000A8188AA|nr:MULTISPECIES: ABC transporter substrate-binding protein [unclassified Nocardioides]